LTQSKAFLKSTKAALYTRETTTDTHCTGGWVGPRGGLDTEARAEVGNLFLNVATGVANEKLNLPHHLKTKKLSCSVEN
jgi:hypothetical protein